MKSYILIPEKWVETYADMLFSYTSNRLKDTEQAKDIVQETFLSAYKSIKTYDARASEKTWLFAICKNKIIDYYRKEIKNTTNLLSQQELIQFDEQGNFNTNHHPQNWNIYFNDTLIEKEFNSIFNVCKNKLNSLQKAVFQLKHVDDYETSEICKFLEITTSNYWVLMHRAKVNLRTCLEKNWINK